MKRTEGQGRHGQRKHRRSRQTSERKNGSACDKTPAAAMASRQGVVASVGGQIRLAVPSEAQVMWSDESQVRLSMGAVGRSSRGQGT